ncbi:MAG: pantoate--beta-alanine ligase [Pseudomonadota bacterium]|nr:pantoate--beta-alanine ligase [Pseudomonadota bacterium]
MKIVTQEAELRSLLSGFRVSGLSCGFVPTMGNLHAGHLALVDAASTHCDRVIVSIFVNPMQFGPNEDLAAYPNTPDADEQGLLEHGVAVLYRPAVEGIYPAGVESQTRVVVPEVSEMLEGTARPGHFTGVATVVNRLFNLVQPDRAFFGKKDYQQYLIIKKMVADLAMNLKVTGVETVRLDSGLAMSSRNNYLSADELIQAAGLNRVIHEIAVQYVADATDIILARGIAELKKKGFVPDYLTVRRQSDLHEPLAGDKKLVVLAAAWLGKTRLIDNLEFVLLSDS